MLDQPCDLETVICGLVDLGGPEGWIPNEH